MINEINKRRIAEYYGERAHFGFLIQSITAMFGKKISLEEIIGKPPFATKKENKSGIEAWKESAKNKGLKYQN